MEHKIEIYKNGTLVSVEDTRTLAGEKSRRIALVKEETGNAILEAYPIYKQNNAALGLYSAEECQAIKDGIQALRDASNAKEAAINACESLTELDGLYL